MSPTAPVLLITYRQPLGGFSLRGWSKEPVQLWSTAVRNDAAEMVTSWGAVPIVQCKASDSIGDIWTSML